jgi:protein-S-isoprenylcysteine O-methyltransferase Ste14
MYVALAIALLAWALWLAHALAPLGVAAFVAWMNRYQIATEERALHALFCAEFERYCSEVRRWL